MAPKKNASTRKRTKQQAEIADEPTEEPTESQQAEFTEEPVSSLVPLLDVKLEETEAEENSAGRLNATKGSGMNPLEVSRMLAMLGKRRKKDHACLRIRNTYVCAYLVFKFISIHISMYMCLYLFMYIRCTCMEIS